MFPHLRTAEPPGARAAAAERPRFECHICSEASERICVRCTRDACDNHLCERCGRCSDCCVCDDQPRGRA